MGGRRFRLGRHRKNEELKRRREKEEKKLESEDTTPLALVVSIPRQSLAAPSLTVSLPLASYLNGSVGSLESLCTRLSKSSLPPSWTVASATPLTLCKLRVQVGGQGSSVYISAAVTIQSDLGWTLSIANQPLTPIVCPFLFRVPAQLTSVSAVFHMVSTLDSVKLCMGNREAKFIELWQHRALTLHGSSGKNKRNGENIGVYAYSCMFPISGPSNGCIDHTSIPGVSSLRHTDCQMLLSETSGAARCSACAAFRSTLSAQIRRQQKTPTNSSHVNHR